MHIYSPRSRLLGSAKELRQDCVPRTLWSYLFGKPLSYAGLLEPELTTPNLNQPFRSQRASVLSIQVAPTPGHPLSDHRNSIRVDDDPPERREHLPRLSHTYSAPLAKPSPNPISPLHSSSHSSSSPSSTSSASFSSSSSPHSSFASSSTSSLFPAYTSYPSQYSVTLADLHEQIESLLMDGADLAQLHLSLSTSLVHANSIHTLSRSDPLLLAINHRIPDSRRTSIEVSVAMGSMRLNQSGPSIAASVAGQLPAVR
ncbi:unnamed protein product [Protopolystoma xenopodis]|uniref:Uncharacterized protein n=1 Tax=Protopolystoma xenopodis TaxID=117903 RepID=A0A3S5BZL8_9PLAT|nr:unnamed protein product [Protopolystoma xenopodis]